MFHPSDHGVKGNENPMSSYYTGWRARHYNMRWHTFTERTLTETLTMMDVQALHHVQDRLGRPFRILDVACGTGVLLKQIAERLPQAELYGVDASSDMLRQACLALKDVPHVQLEHVDLSAGLPYPPQSFDLITCTNVLHDLAQPTEVLAGLGRLLSAEGTLILEDYARREPPFPWWLIEWLARWIEGGHGRVYTFSEAEQLAKQAQLHVTCGKSFVVDWLWHGWVLCLSEGSMSASAQRQDESNQ